MLADLTTQPQPKRDRAKARNKIKEVGRANGWNADDVANEKELHGISKGLTKNNEQRNHEHAAHGAVPPHDLCALKKGYR